MLKNWKQMHFSMTAASPLSISLHSNHLEQFGTLSNLTHQREFTTGTESGILTMVWLHLGGSASGLRAMYSLWGKSMQLSIFFAVVLILTLSGPLPNISECATGALSPIIYTFAWIRVCQRWPARFLLALLCTLNCPASGAGATHVQMFCEKSGSCSVPFR